MGAPDTPIPRSLFVNDSGRSAIFLLRFACSGSQAWHDTRILTDLLRKESREDECMLDSWLILALL